MEAVPFTELGQVSNASNRIGAAAAALGFADEPLDRVARIVTELATNAVKHGGGGELLIGSFEDRRGSGIEILALDRGPGMIGSSADVQRGGTNITASDTGLGLVRSLSHAFDVFAPPSYGAVILARLRAGPLPAAGTPLEQIPACAGLTVPLRGQQTCGDAYAARRIDDGWMILLADGLGHGPEAAEASQAAIRLFMATEDRSPANILGHIHHGIRGSRGAAASVVRCDAKRQMLVYAGVGNVAGVIVSDAGHRRMVSHAGTVGVIARRLQSFEHMFLQTDRLVLHTDGVAPGWDLGAYPGLSTADPALIAAVLYRDFGQGRDDKGVVVAQGGLWS